MPAQALAVVPQVLPAGQVQPHIDAPALAVDAARASELVPRPQDDPHCTQVLQLPRGVDHAFVFVPGFLWSSVIMYSQGDLR